jgi:diketogulonate reductase-like aldo/keto reductase
MSGSGVPALQLSDGNRIPQLGFGVFKIPNDQTQAAVESALESGYRSIDAAAFYNNEKGVGAAIAASGIGREDLFVTSKEWNDAQGRGATMRSFDRSLRELGLDYLDMFLIHWPVPAQDLYVDTWRTLIELQASGRVRSIGVSNFEPAHLERLRIETDVVPVINQVELHPYLTQSTVRNYCATHSILVEAWSPLAKGGSLLLEREPAEIGELHGKSAAQVIIRWHVQLGNVVIPKSVTPSRIAQNIDVFDFELSDAELAAINSLDRDHRTGPDPNVFVAPAA